MGTRPRTIASSADMSGSLSTRTSESTRIVSSPSRSTYAVIVGGMPFRVTVKRRSPGRPFLPASIASIYESRRHPWLAVPAGMYATTESNFGRSRVSCGRDRFGRHRCAAPEDGEYATTTLIVGQSGT
jgi:hypothetical protein